MQRIFTRILDWLVNLRNRTFLFLDAITFCVTPVLAMALRLDGFSEIWTYRFDLISLAIFFGLWKFIVFFSFGLYRRLWRYASIDELGKIVVAGLVVLFLQTMLFLGILLPAGLITDHFPRSIPVIDGLLTLAAFGGLRYLIRMGERLRQRFYGRVGSEPVVVIGGGETGHMILKEIQSNPQLGFHAVGIIDDNPQKHGARILGVDVLGGRHHIPHVVQRTGAR